MFSIVENNFQTLDHSHKDLCDAEYNVPHCSADSSHTFIAFPEYAWLVLVLQTLQELLLLPGMLLSRLHMAASHHPDLTSNVPFSVKTSSATNTSLLYNLLSTQLITVRYYLICSPFFYQPSLLLLLSHFSRVRLCATPQTGSAVPGTLQARTQEWVAISFSNNLHQDTNNQTVPSLFVSLISMPGMMPGTQQIVNKYLLNVE